MMTSADSDRATLIALNAELQRATMAYNVAALDKLITPDYILVSSRGTVYDRRAFLADAGDRSAEYELNEPEDVQVHLYAPDAAVVTAVLHVRIRVQGKIIDRRVRYGDVWVKRDGRWRYAFGEASPFNK